jgi:glycosyltransferase involved in cell wall biosynthesis
MTLLRSRLLERSLRKVDADIVLLIRSTYRPLAAPYVPFIDTTLAMANRDWPAMDVWSRSTSRRLRALERAFLIGAAHVLTASDAAAQSAVDHGVHPDKVTVVGGGANFEPAPSSVAGQTRPVILFVGRDLRRKGGDLLIETFKSIRAKIPESELWIVGVPSASSLPGVRVLGHVADRQELARLYRSARVFALPARFEPFGLVLLEAMSQGVPCVGSRTGAIQHMISHQETGFLIPLDDEVALERSLLHFLRDSSAAQQAGTRAIERVCDQFTWNHVAERIAAALSTVRLSDSVH